MTQSAQSRYQVPWVTLSFIFSNLLTALLGALDQDFTLSYSFDPSKPSLVSAVVSLFLHANMIHLLGNMVFLAAVGPRVESVAGRWQFITIYFSSGLIGVLAHLAMVRLTGSPVPLLGASGAIAGCVGYCAIRFMNRRVPLAPKITVTVGSVSLVWVVLQAAGAFVKTGQGLGGSAFWAHLAGFFGGLLLSYVFKAPQQAKMQFGHDVLDQMSIRGPGALLAAAEKHLAEHPNDPRALRDLASAYHQMGERKSEAEALIKLLEVTPASSQSQVVSELVETGEMRLLKGASLLKFAQQYRQENPKLTRSILIEMSRDQSEPLRPDALLLLAQLVEEQEKEPILAELQAKYEFHPATESARVQGLIK